MENLTLEKVKEAEGFLKFLDDVNHSIKEIAKAEWSVKIGDQELTVPLNEETFHILYRAVQEVAGYSK